MMEELKNVEIIKSKECMVKRRKGRVIGKRGSLVRRWQDKLRLIIKSAIIHYKSILKSRVLGTTHGAKCRITQSDCKI
jgi:hypothetical protein